MEPFLAAIADVWQPHEGQREFLLCESPVQVLACGRRWGKTDAVAVKTLYQLTRPSPSRHLLLAPTADQASILFERVLELLDATRETLGLPKPKLRRTPHLRMTLGPHRVVARSGHVGRSLRGNEATNIIVDETAFLPEAIVTEVAMPMLATSAQGTITLISTPCGSNHFKRFFQMGQDSETGVWSRQSPSWESPHVSRSFLDLQKRLISERAWRVEYGAEFLDQSGRVFRQEAIEQCLVGFVPDTLEGPVSIGIDWARYGDWTVAMALRWHRDLRLPPEPDLMRELEHFEAQEIGAGRVSLEAQPGFHDDMVVALALAAFGLPRGSGSVQTGNRRRFNDPA